MSLILVQIVSLVYVILLNIFYFSKSHVSTVENKIYKYLLSLNVIGLINDLGCFYTVSHMDEIPLLNAIVTKLLLVYYILFMSIYSIYVIVISYKRDDMDVEKFNEKYRIIKICCAISFIIFSAIISFLPMEYYNDGKYIYSYGVSVNFLSVVLVIYATIWIIAIVKNFKNIKLHKYLPVIIFVVLALIGGLIARSYPYVLLTTPIETFIIFLMYFTIENPDVKMLDEVHRAKEITDSANEEKAMFLYNMTNEIRNITKDIDDSAENILSETDNKNINIENINDNARDIKVSTAKFTSMTNEILDISSIDSANIKIYNDKYNIKLILKELVQIYKNSAEKKGLEFRTNIASDLPEYLYGDAVNVKVSLNTILDNAIKYTEHGFIEFNVNAIMKNDIARLIISVEDSGIGMKAEDLNKIFNKREEDKENTNLKSNLYNAKKLVTLMGGTIIPSSIYGKGTIIKVVLDQKIGEIETELNKYESVYDKKKILIVDDNPSSIKMITKLLKDSNMIIDTANSGKECLDKIRDKEKYDLILLDENMTPLNGLTVMRKLREIRNFNINVILLTKNNDYEYNEEYLRYGFKDYLIKPIDKDKLLKKISKYSK